VAGWPMKGGMANQTDSEGKMFEDWLPCHAVEEANGKAEDRR
jgi:hypothetical protein